MSPFKNSIITGKKSASYDSKHNLNKDMFNIKVTSAMKKQKSRTVLLLDSKRMRSTEYCINIGIQKENITSIESNRLVHNYHLRNGINSFHGNVWSVVSKPNDDIPYDTLNFDAVSSCQTVSKNIENLFKNNYLSKKSVLALTVTKRSNLKGANCYEDYDKLKQSIQRYSSKYGYKCTVDSEHEQNKVLSIIYTVISS